MALEIIRFHTCVLYSADLRAVSVYFTAKYTTRTQDKIIETRATTDHDNPQNVWQKDEYQFQFPQAFHAVHIGICFL
jgi:hypothetical protein